MGFLRETIRAYQKNDPAARSALEIFFLYNGLHATIYYRISHWLYCHHCRFLARWVSQHAKWVTGVEIHPPPPLAAAWSLTTAPALWWELRRKLETTACCTSA